MSICTNCKHNIGTCRYSKYGKPIDGWKAEKRTIPHTTDGIVRYYEQSYNVLECPQYARERTGAFFNAMGVEEYAQRKDTFKERLTVKEGDKIKVPMESDKQKGIIGVVLKVYPSYALLDTGKYKTTVKLTGGKIL